MPDQERVPQPVKPADSKSHAGPGIGQLLAAGAAADAVSKPPSTTGQGRALERPETGLEDSDDVAPEGSQTASRRDAA